MLNRVLREMQESYVRGIYTAIPATVLEFDSKTQRAKVKIDIKEQIGDKLESIAALEDVGVASMRSGGYTITFPVAKGDKVQLVFNHRSIDKWLVDGSEESKDTRTHSINDAIANNLIIYPLNDSIGEYDNESLTLRNMNNSIYIKVKQSGIEILGDVKILGNVDIDGKLIVTGIIKSLKDVFAKTVSLFAHLHSGVKPGPSKTGKPE